MEASQKPKCDLTQIYWIWCYIVNKQYFNHNQLHNYATAVLMTYC